MAPSNRQTDQLHLAYDNLKIMMEGLLENLKTGSTSNIDMQMEKLGTLQSQLELDLAAEISTRKQLSSNERQLYTEMISELLALNMELSRLARTYMVSARNELNRISKGIKTISSYNSGSQKDQNIISISS